ncbi:NUDIX hydrolase [Hyphomicrobium sp. 2TAF46]|uniref:NUDIX hydrolase n=1 Tax=Hyphomicrobium sp. 2TAF46 TaxID=3233019 RepID=UPI003F9373C8
MKDRAMPDAVFPFVDGVKSVSNCSLKLSGEPWPFALAHAADIDAHWQAATKSNSSYFNGIVHLIDSVRFGDDVFEATLTRTDFKSYLYWRLSGYPEAGVLDGFGSAVIRSSDGDILLAQQMPGNVNYGFACLPSGFIDARDVQPDGTIDIARHIGREIAEELGVVANHVEREGRFIVVRSGTQVCFAILFNAALSTAEIAKLVDEHNAMSDDPELDSIIPVASLTGIADLKMLPYARALLEALFAAR